MQPHDLAARIAGRAPGLSAKTAIVLGSGLGGLADEIADAVRIPYADLPGFPASGVSSHRGEVVLGRLAGRAVMVLSGRAHTYEHGDARAMAVPIATLAAAGVETLILTNAAGSLLADVAPGQPMLITDHIAGAGPNPLIGVGGDDRFVSMVDAYDPALRALARKVAKEAKIPLAEGVYMWFTGPSFETPAEIRMARVLGADAVGMSTVPEVILARHAGLKVLALSMITNHGAGMTGRPLSHDETKSVAAEGAARFRRLVAGIVAELAA
ncbi:purine-nucleoside phosphorylase [Siculibacillus lacustris]|uniref:Purine nucleoside phosphorylase n=1 Tax=Siculibacillus lacustris TaxID=1549641 RepID=A0A4Q9VT70_9HYPH|nr:purine-nucleoside phosphorylase [Siculibacillus lacustris]TBW39239.1 purine-nucleoside phosphorylase [Siculibacillus lacustris]